MRVVLLIIDSLRADLPGYAGGPAETPTLDALAARSARFEHAYCSGSWTVPSVVAMMTGRWPQRAGVCNWRHDLPADVQSLASLLGGAGLPFRAFVPAPRWWFAGWPGVTSVGWSQDLPAVEAALAEPGPGLVLIHHWNTHFPYLPSLLPMPGYRQAMDVAVRAFAHAPDRMAPRFRSLYQRSVEHLSEALLPRWLEAAAQSGEPTLFVLTADHGENHGEALPPGRAVEHIFDLHGRWLCDQTLRVPLLCWGQTALGPVRPGARGGVARGVDLAPTLAGALGLPGPQGADGASLLPSLTDGQPAPSGGALTVASHNVYFPETYPEDGKIMWQRYCWSTPRARWIWDSRGGERWREGEASAQEDAVVWADLEAAWQAAVNAATSPLRPAAPPPPEALIQRRMRGLGYLDGG